MVYMTPRQPLAPNNGAPNRILSQQEFSFVYPKAIEKPSIMTYNTPGRGMNGEHDNGRSGSLELWRSVYARRKYGMR
jgi:hypothetical protein